MQHHRREKEFRKNDSDPHIVPNWSRRGSYGYRTYRNVIFVIDQCCKDWLMALTKELLGVQFDLDNRPEDRFEVLEAEKLEGPRDEGLVEINPVLDDPSIEAIIVGHEQEDEMRREQHVEWANGNHLTKYRCALYDVWSNMTSALYDCTYRTPCCDGCNEHFEHTDCALEKDRHYLNDGGDRVSCSEFKGPWPDDDSKHDDYNRAEEDAVAIVIDRPGRSANLVPEAGFLFAA